MFNLKFRYKSDNYESEFSLGLDVAQYDLSNLGSCTHF